MTETKVGETKVEINDKDKGKPATAIETELVVEQEAVELTPTEQAAKEQGWVPKEEWVEAGNSPDDWRSAKEFQDRGELYKSLHGTKRELKQTQATLTALQKHHKYVFEKAHKAAVADLKREKRVAMQNEQFDRVEQIDEELEQANEAFQTQKVELDQAHQAANVQTPNPDFQNWVNVNPWYERDSDLREEADATGLVYFNKNPGTPPAQVLKYVAEAMKKRHPEKFGVKRAAPNPTVGVDRTNTKSRVAEIQLDAMETEIMNTLVKDGVMTAAEYKAELKKVKGL